MIEKRRKYVEKAKRLYQQKVTHFVNKKCANCGVFLNRNNLNVLCEKCLVDWKYMITINWVDYHHGNHLLRIKYSYYENGEFWFTDYANVQLNKNIITTKEAYLKLIEEPSLLKKNIMVDVDPINLKISFPRYPKWIGVDMHETRA